MEMTIGQRIKERRVNIGLTQEALAEALYIQKTTVSAYENDKVDIKIGSLKAMASILHTTVGYLVDGEEMQFDPEIMDLAVRLQEVKDKKIREVAVEQIKVLLKLAQ